MSSKRSVAPQGIPGGGKATPRAFVRAAATALTISFAIIGILLMTLVALTRTDSTGVTRVAGRPVLTVLSDSMTPTFKAGDILVEESVDGRAADLRVGTVITFRVNGDLVSHRIIRVDSKGGGVAYRTQGDANNTADTTPVRPDQVVGTYSRRIPNAGSALAAVQTPTGLALVILVTLVLLLAPRFARAWRAAGATSAGDEIDTPTDTATDTATGAREPAGLGRSNH
jgi:signal peptidase